MTNKQTLIAGGLALAVGFVGGNVAGRNAGSGADRLANNVKSIASQNDGLTEQVGSLGAELTALQERFGTLEAGMGEQIGTLEAGMSERMGTLEAGMGERMGTLESGMGAQFEALSAQVSDMAGASSSGMTDLGAQIGDGLASIEAGQSEMMMAVKSAPAAAAVSMDTIETAATTATTATATVAATAAAAAAATVAAATAPEATASEANAAADAPAATDASAAADAPDAEGATAASAAVESAPAMLSNGIGVGQTAVFADGALRVFASGINADNAMLSVNGLDRKRVSLGGRVAAMAGETACLVTLDAIAGNQVGLSSACGDDRPAPDGIAPGMTTSFGATRVFYSGVAGEDMVRIAINGVSTMVLGYGEAVDVPGQSCSVRLEGLDRNFAALSSDC